MDAEALSELLCRLCALERGGFRPPSVGDDAVAALARMAGEQGVAGWLADRLASGYPDWEATPRLLRLLRPLYLAALVRNGACVGVAWRVAELLRGRGVRCVALKGAALVGTVWADAAMRAIGDVDILVLGGRVWEARDLLVADGARDDGRPRRPMVVDRWRDHLEGLVYCGVTVELHHKLSRHDGGRPFLADAASFVERGERVDALSPTAHFCYLCAHARKHWLRGHGSFKWLLDLAVFLSARDDVAAFVRRCLAVAPAVGREVRWGVSVAAPLMPEWTRAALEDAGFALRGSVPRWGGWRSRLANAAVEAADAASLLAYAWRMGDGARGGWRNVREAVFYAVGRKQKKNRDK